MLKPLFPAHGEKEHFSSSELSQTQQSDSISLLIQPDFRFLLSLNRSAPLYSPIDPTLNHQGITTILWLINSRLWPLVSTQKT